MKNLGDTMRISGWGNCLMGISNIPWDRTFWKRSRYARSRLGTEWDTVFSVLEVVWVQRHKRNWIIIFMSLQSFRDPYFWVLEILYVYDFLIFFLKFLFVVVDHFKSLCWICYNISSVLCFVFFFFFFAHRTWEILSPWPRIKPALLALEGGILTTGPQGKSRAHCFYFQNPHMHNIRLKFFMSRFSSMFLMFLTLSIVLTLLWVNMFHLLFIIISFSDCIIRPPKQEVDLLIS